MALKCKLQPSVQAIDNEDDSGLFGIFGTFPMSLNTSQSQMLALFSFIGVVSFIVLWYNKGSKEDKTDRKQAIETKISTKINSEETTTTLITQKNLTTAGIVHRKIAEQKPIETSFGNKVEEKCVEKSTSNTVHLRSLHPTDFGVIPTSDQTADSSSEKLEKVKIVKLEKMDLSSVNQVASKSADSKPKETHKVECYNPLKAQAPKPPVLENSTELFKTSEDLKNASSLLENNDSDVTKEEESNKIIPEIVESVENLSNEINQKGEEVVEHLPNEISQKAEEVVEQASNETSQKSEVGYKAGSVEPYIEKVYIEETAKIEAKVDLEDEVTKGMIADVKHAIEVNRLKEAAKTEKEKISRGKLEKTNSILEIYKAKHVNLIADHFNSLQEISEAIKKAGLEHSQLIFGIDFTISNLENGTKTFNGRSLHYQDEVIKNPYQKVIEILGKTLECFDADGKIPAFGFGDSKTKDRRVFPFSNDGYCLGFKDVLVKYNQVLKSLQLSGPTNFAPLIKEAIKIVKTTKQYHILVIVADGQVTNERQTREAIVEASKYPISIIMVGVGDGPWDTMNEFDDSLPKRQFDNFQFVNYHEVINGAENPDEKFALHTLMEIPDQYNEIKKLSLLD